MPFWGDVSGRPVPHVQDDEKICESKNGLMRPCTLFIFASQMGRSPHLSTHLPCGSWGHRKELLRKREHELREMEMHIGYEERDTASLWTWTRWLDWTCHAGFKVLAKHLQHVEQCVTSQQKDWWLELQYWQIDTTFHKDSSGNNRILHGISKAGCQPFGTHLPGAFHKAKLRNG